MSSTESSLSVGEKTEYFHLMEKVGALGRRKLAQGVIPQLSVDAQDLAKLRWLYRQLSGEAGALEARDASEAPVVSAAQDSLQSDMVIRSLRESYAIALPARMQKEVRDRIRRRAMELRQPMTADWIYEVFRELYVDYDPYFRIPECHFTQTDGILAETVIEQNGTSTRVSARGNGSLDAVSNTVKAFFGISYELTEYEEHTLSKGSSSRAIAYVGITCEGVLYWGAGIHEDIITASVYALCAAANKLPQLAAGNSEMDARVVQMMNYIQHHYRTVNLTAIAEEFHLSETYVSRLIKQKTGKTFGEHVQTIRLKKARTLLRNTTMTVETIAQSVGYPSVEHFNRIFKKTYQLTPVQYRNAV